jgi:glycosyltransferase involved in cell wall biosynthesis
MPERNPKTGQKYHCMVVFAHYPAGEIRVQRQAEALIGQGYQVDVLCLRDTGEPSIELVNGVNVHRLPVTRDYDRTSFSNQFFEYFKFLMAVMFALFRLYPRRRYPVVQVHNLPDFLVFAAWFPKLFGARLILDLHDLMPEFFAARTKHSMDSGLVRLVALQERLSCGFANHVITVTEIWKEALVKRGIARNKITVIMNVADDRIFKYQNSDKPPSDPHTFRLIYHGNLVARYGIDLVLEAMACLGESTPGLALTIHSPGNGGYARYLSRLAEKLGIEDRVRFSHDIRPISELPELIRTADVGLVPYRRDIFTDGILPTKLMEYTALGIPVIAAKTPAIEAYFDDSMVEYFSSGDVDELADSIRFLYADRQQLATLAKNADKFNQRYNWTLIGAEYVDLVKRLGNQA